MTRTLTVARSWVKVVASLVSSLTATCSPTLILDRDEAEAFTEGAGGQSSIGGAANAGAKSSPKTPSRRHVILVIGDGMQLSYEVAASRYLHGIDNGLSFHAFPVVSYQTNWNVNVYNKRADELGASEYSPDSFEPKIGYDPELGGEFPYPILEDNDQKRAYFSFANWLHPDSAATATAMSTGTKTTSGAIAWRPGGAEDGALETSPGLLRRLYGMSVGFVTTIPFSHARSAGFFAHNQSRFNEPDIANEILATVRPEVVIGGGWEDPEYYRQADLERAVASNDWVFDHLEAGVDSNAALRAASARAIQANKRLLGLYEGGDSVDFVAPVPAHSPKSPRVDAALLARPTLSSSSVAALEVLSQDQDGFFLLIQQGQIDWTSDPSNFGKMIGCVWELDQAVQAVTGFVDRTGDDIDWSNTTLVVTAGQANGYMRFGKTLRQGELPVAVIDSSTEPRTISYPNGEISYGSPGLDTSELLAVYAKGMAAAKIHDYENVYPGRRIIDNTSIYKLTLDAAER